MNILKIIGLIFSAVGMILLIAAGFVFQSTRTFLESSEQATGTIKDLVLGDSSSSSGVYYPVVTFKTSSGETIEFRSSVGANPPSYRKGELVPVRYDPRDPYRAGIDSFFYLWFTVILLSGMGTVFGGIGGVMAAIWIRSIRKDRWLQQHGQTILTEFQSVELNTSVSVNGRNPYRIVSQWLDPMTNKVYLFQSKDLLFNPEKFIQKKEIPVLIDPNNPKKFLMDTSFLPEAAE
jgi:hypothetical protein